MSVEKKQLPISVNPLFTASFTIFLMEELLRHLGSELGIIRLNSLKLTE
jgi:hypothetical protein